MLTKWENSTLKHKVWKIPINEVVYS